jgi:hypothetical protein
MYHPLGCPVAKEPMAFGRTNIGNGVDDMMGRDAEASTDIATDYRGEDSSNTSSMART